MEKNNQIIVSRASIHICANPELLVTITELRRPSRIHLPDGSSKIALLEGTARLSKDLILTNVMNIPKFTHNLISIAQLVQ